MIRTAIHRKQVPCVLRSGAFPVLLATLLTGCAHVSSMAPAEAERTFAEADGGARRDMATVRMNDGRELAAQQLLVHSDSLTWFEPATGRIWTVATAQVREVRFKGEGWKVGVASLVHPISRTVSGRKTRILGGALFGIRFTAPVLTRRIVRLTRSEEPPPAAQVSVP